jgi:hypothetical protein
VLSGTTSISTLKAASGSKLPTPSNNGQLMESAYYLPPRLMQKIARGSRSPFILRVDVFALSLSLHSNLRCPDRAGPLLRAARRPSSQLPRFDLHERTLPRLKSIPPVESLHDGNSARSDWVLTRAVRASTRGVAGRYCG